MNTSVFYDRAYGEQWDELTEEEIEEITMVMENMTDTELALYDEYLWYSEHECVIDEAIQFAVGDRYNPYGKYGFPFIGKEDKEANLLKLGKARFGNELTEMGLYLESAFE